MPQKLIHKTREAWLMEALTLLKPIFTERGFKVPEKIRVSCGFPSKNPLGMKLRRIGECWTDDASAGKVFEIFVSPTLSDPYEVLDTLLHEVIHATVGIKCGHGGEFKICANVIGMTGKMTCCVAGERLKPRLEKYLTQLGTYSHDQLEHMTSGRKKDTCRLLKASCPDCGYIVRVSRKCLDIGCPTCPCGTEMTEG